MRITGRSKFDKDISTGLKHNKKSFKFNPITSKNKSIESDKSSINIKNNGGVPRLKRDRSSPRLLKSDSPRQAPSRNLDKPHKGYPLITKINLASDEEANVPQNDNYELE